MSDEPTLRQQISYQQNFEQFRSLNVQMNHVPVLAMTFTGGLWFGAGVTENLPQDIRFGLLLLAGFGNLALILTVLRIRDVMQSYLEKIKEFSPQTFATGRPKKPKLSRLNSYSMISIYCTLMLIGAVFSFFGAFWIYSPFGNLWWAGLIGLALVLVAIYWFILKN